MKNNKDKGSVLVGILLVFAVLAVICFLFFKMNKVIGSDGSIFTNNQNYIFEKLSYRFGSPQVGDIVLFRYQNGSSGDMDYIGAVVEMESSNEGEIQYSIVNKLKPKYVFKVTEEEILAHAIYPQTTLDVDTVNQILINVSNLKTDK